MFAAAGEKYRAARDSEPDKYEPLYNWGTALLEQSRRAGDREKARLLAAAGEKLEAAIHMDPSKTSHQTYNLACVFACLGDENKSRHNLEIAERYRTLPSLAHLAADTDLDFVRDRPWFKALLARQTQ